MKQLLGIFLSFVLSLTNVPVNKDASIINIESTILENKHRIIVSSDKEIREYTPIRFENPDRLAVDIKGTVLTSQNKEFDTKGNYVYRIRSAQYNSNPDIVRVVADLKGWTDYEVTLSENHKQLYIDFDNRPTDITDFKFASSGAVDSLDVFMKYFRTPVISEEGSGTKFAVDFPMASARNLKSNTHFDGNYVQSVEWTQADANTARLLLTVKAGCLIDLKKGENAAKLEITPANSKNISYAGTEIPKFTIDSEWIGINYFNYRNRMEDDRYILTVPSKLLGLTAGRMVVNDSWLDHIDFIRDESLQTTDVIFYPEKNVSYSLDSVKNRDEIAVTVSAPITRQDGSNVSINPKAKEKLVVIDPGHGGGELGATYPTNISDPNLAQVKEKDLNLDISLKLYELLKNAGIKVQLTRQEDRAVDLVERADIANRQNASLLVSVHNNSGNSGERGTMTLFYPTEYDKSYGITGERAAQIVQDEMLKNLGTTDRGLWKRPRLAVLNNAKMPVILAEVAYISDESDRQKLLTESFRIKAAEALFSGIVKTLNEMVTQKVDNPKGEKAKPVSAEPSGKKDIQPRNINGFSIPSTASAQCEYKGNTAETPSLFDLSIRMNFAAGISREAQWEEQRKEARQVLLTRLDEAAVNKIMESISGLKDLNSYCWEDEIYSGNYEIWVRSLRNTGIVTIDVMKK